MARPLALSPVAELLRSRVAFLQSVQIVPLEELAKNWRISKSTLYRYVSAEYRSKSRTYNNGYALRGSCTECGVRYTDHDRCTVCTILTHGEQCCIGTVKRSKV